MVKAPVEDNVALGCVAGGCLLYAIYVMIVLAVLVGGAILIWQAVLN